MRNVKIIQIHVDYKFVSLLQYFESNKFDVVDIIIQNELKYNGPLKDSYLLFHEYDGDVEEIIKISNEADLLVICGLTKAIERIILAVSQNVVIAWQFFGYELYASMTHFCYTNKTLTALRLTNRSRSAIKIKRIPALYRLYDRVLSIVSQDAKTKNKAIKRINYFIGPIKSEYDYLKIHYPYLPSFIQRPFPNVFISKQPQKKSVPAKVIIGNNQSAFNNHLDIIDIIKNSKSYKNYNLILPFNYAWSENYSDKVIQSVKYFENFEVIDKLISFDKYEALFNDASAFVHNGIRQMAIKNVFIAIENGVKIYLNRKGILYAWLVAEDFLVYSIENFAQDLESGNLLLAVQEAADNRSRLFTFSLKYSVGGFQESLLSNFFKYEYELVQD